MFLVRLGFCLAVFGLCLYSYQNKQNEVTHLKILLPQLEKEVLAIKEESLRLCYQIDQIENPSHLIELAHAPEFRHLKHPLMKEIKEVPEAIALNAN